MSSRGRKKNPEKDRSVVPEKQASKTRLQRSAEEKYGKYHKAYLVMLTVFVFIAIILLCMPLFRVDIKALDSYKSLLGDYDTYTDFSTPKLFSVVFSGGDVVEYLKKDVPALRRAVNMGQESAIDAAVSSMGDGMVGQITGVFYAVFAVFVVMLLLLVAAFVLLIIKLVKNKNLSNTFLSLPVYIFTVLAAVTFFLFIAVIIETTKDIVFTVGAGMWVLVAVSALVSAFFIVEEYMRRKLKKITAKNGR